MPEERIKAVLDFWFDGVTDQSVIDKKKAPFKNWFTASQAFDAAVNAHFHDDYIKAAGGLYASWSSSAKGRLALIIIFDQLGRNLFRGSPAMYRADPLAQRLSIEGIEQKADEELALIERLFFYMPLMHAEDLELQKLSVVCFKKLRDAAARLNSANEKYYDSHLAHAEKHYEEIRRHGRFTHRDKVLNRQRP